MNGVGLVCHRCGYVPGQPGETQCPRDHLLLVPPAEHHKAPHDPYLGTLLGGKYPILGIIGIGGMGAVYRSVQPLVLRPVAIKVILPLPRMEAEAARLRFMREAQTIAALSHQSLVTLFDFGVEPNGTLYMVMEYVQGRMLSQFMREGGLTARQFVRIILAVLEGLDVAHSRGFVHRDIKPDNIMILDEQPRSGELPRVKLLDFGLTKLLSASSGQLTQVGLIFGTPQYMAPEQATGETVDERTDTYAVALILYEGLSGQLPFLADNPLAIVHLRTNQDPPRLPRLPQVPEGLAEIVHRGMARARSQRYRAAELAELLRYLEWGPAAEVRLPPCCKNSLFQTPGGRVAHPDSTPRPRTALVEEPEKPSRSRRLLWGALGAAAAGLCGLLLLLVLPAAEPVQPLSAARTATRTQPPTTAPAPVPDPAPPPPAAPPPTASATGAGTGSSLPPSTASPPSRIQIRLESEPSGAMVADATGKLLGTTPLWLALPYSETDQAEFQVKAPGYHPRSLTLPQDGRQERHEVQLQPVLKPTPTRPSTPARPGGLTQDGKPTVVL